MPSGSWSLEDISPVLGTVPLPAGSRPIVRDLELDSTRNLVVRNSDLQFVYDGEAIAQAVGVRLRFFEGEWFLNLETGMPYFQEILVKNPNIALIKSYIRETILDTPGINEVADVTLAFNTATRILSVGFKATTDLGELISENLKVEVEV